jgi:hypothetical protein
MVRMAGVLACLALVATVSASASDGWKRVIIERHQGKIDATLSYEARPDYDGLKYRRMTLVVHRAGNLAIDWLFQAGVESGVTLTLRSVWGDSDPEALVAINTGGDTCCVQLGVGLIDNAGAGRVIFNDFAMGGWRGQTHAGLFDFISIDYRFFCGFTDCASSTEPLQILAIDQTGQRFVDVTRSRPGLITADAASLWHGYLSERGERNHSDLMGQLAPWCADEYLLGRKARCDRGLAQALARGDLNGSHIGIDPVKRGRAEIDVVEKTLVAWGY